MQTTQREQSRRTKNWRDTLDFEMESLDHHKRIGQLRKTQRSNKKGSRDQSIQNLNGSLSRTEQTILNIESLSELEESKDGDFS